ncbi:hypothetical protein Ngar_c20280 [Candidatus Nitrososphaera gargensis Ga9.2]|uniref:Uncharacterized protein n=1 Tax=Nitrososphaera gargensis (strain Ga9.2) TaxID=1237085 RepID=K0IGL7_NITGG|nr:hypothetical protein [Candidatus Nitrososphaera gargensis]AFU58960.1 hypothetical protein Ngar_c20280 [Candidatus Nitrososphaera gargensis Ga9.2]
MSPSSGISSEQIASIDISPFWKKNEPLLRELERSEMPSKSRLIYKEIASNTDSNNNHILTNYDLVNIYDNRKHFFGIVAELSPDRSSVIREEIVAGNGLSNAKKTMVDGSRISNKAHIDWLKTMSQNDVCRLFRT